MARLRIIPDTAIFALVLAALRDGGEKAVSFGLISQASGLAAPTLAQRFGSVEGMLRAALMAEWSALAKATEAAEQVAMASPKGAQAMLKALNPPDLAVLAASARDPALIEAAEAWRVQMETALVQRLGGGTKGRDATALVFAAWQGRQLWAGAGGKGFRLAEMLKRFS